jgi:NAD(P)-dependent dehydrogenase (short-subunit alcohol dehydrogenase family)
MKILENKVAIVTGAGSGIGRAIAVKYAEEGAKVVVSDVNEKGGNETVSLIKAKRGEAIFITSDSSSAESNEALVSETIKHFGALHIACNNAGVGGALAPTAEYPLDM